MTVEIVANLEWNSG